MSNRPELDRVLADIGTERLRQVERWGVQRHTWLEWLGILAEEFGEAAVEANQLRWSHENASLENLRAELVQTAAVAAAIVEHIDEVRGARQG